MIKTLAEAESDKLLLITHFNPEIALDLAIFPTVKCPIKKPSRHYNHREWIEREVNRINANGGAAFLVMNEKKETALGIFPPRNMAGTMLAYRANYNG